MITMNCNLCEARGAELQKLRTALQEICDAPYSQVNDSESLRHSIKGMQHTAREALGK